jgi:hypothetical protein
LLSWSQLYNQSRAVNWHRNGYRHLPGSLLETAFRWVSAGHINVAQRRGQKRPGPARKSCRRGLVQQDQNPLAGRLGINRHLARPWLVLESFKAAICKAMPPEADNPRLHTDFLSDRACAATLSRQKHNPGPFQIPLQRHRRTAASFQYVAIFPRNTHFSCFGNHPDLESRLMFHGKRVLRQRRRPHGL